MSIFKFKYLVIFNGLSLSVSAPTSDKNTLERIKTIFEKSDTHSLAGAIKRTGEVVYQKAFVMTDLEQKGINTLHTKFEARSVSKQFRA